MKRFRLLLLPSLTSGACCLLLAGLLLGASAWAFIDENQLFYEYIFGSYGFKTALLQAPDELWSLHSALAGSTATYYILIVVCGIVAGLATYTVLELASRLRRNTDEVLHEMHSRSAAHRIMVREAFERLALRTLSLAGWAVFTAAFVSFLLPSCLLLAQTGIDKLSGSMPAGWLLIIASELLLGICLHVHVVFARLVMLRPRLFGDSDIEETGRA